MNIKSKVCFAVLVLIISSMSLNAQWNFSLSTDQEFNSNPFLMPDSEGELISSVDLGVEKEFEELNILYYGSYAHFQKSILRDYYWHQLGLYSSTDNSIYGIYAEQRINKTDYNFYNYNNFAAYVKHSVDMDFVQSTLLASVNYKDYQNLAEYNNILATAGININKSFETKTTLIMEALVNYKNYVNSGGTTVQTVVTGGEYTGSGYGRGHMYNAGGETTSTITRNLPEISTTQLYLSFRIFESTGLAVYTNQRFLLSEKGSWVGNFDYNYGDESDLYDDPISRKENTYAVQLTQILPLGITFKGIYSYSSRVYPLQGIYTDAETYLENTDRNDKLNSVYFTLNKSISVGINDYSHLNIGLSAGLLHNNSDSYWYNYESSRIALNLGLQF